MIATETEITVLPPETNNANSNGGANLIQIPAQQRATSLAVYEQQATLDRIEKLSRVLAHSAFVPKHLVVSGDPERTIATCFRVVAQADRWGFDPFAVADETYSVSGKLGYGGKLVAAVVNSRANLDGRLSYSFNGRGDDLTVTVTGKFKNEDEPRTVTARLGDVKTANQMWTKDPEQKLCYTGAIKWARRHCPEVVTGVLTFEDLEIIAEQEVPPPVDPAIAEAKKREAAAKQAEAMRLAGVAGNGTATSGTATAKTDTPSPAELAAAPIGEAAASVINNSEGSPTVAEVSTSPQAEASVASVLKTEKGSATATQIASIQALVKQKGWHLNAPKNEPDYQSQTVYLKGKGVQTFRELSEATAAKLIAGLQTWDDATLKN